MFWKCVDCGKEEDRPPTKAARKRCMPCRMRFIVGENNPNYRNVGWKICKQCGNQFKSYIKTRKYCSKKCHTGSIPKKVLTIQLTLTLRVSKEKKKRESCLVTKECRQCKTLFSYYKSSKKLFCSYKCHLDSGGAHRAGMAAAMAKTKYGAKKDANHADVVSALKGAGASVIDTSHIGCGFPDLIVGYAGGTMLMEIKNPKTSYGKRGLNKNQQIWKDGWIGGPYSVVDSVDSALRAIHTLKTMEDE